MTTPISAPSLAQCLDALTDKAYLQHMDQDLARSLEEKHQSACRRCTLRILRFPGFDYLMSLIIVLNVVAMIVEIDQSASREDTSAYEVTHWTDIFRNWTAIVSWAALTIFAFELGVRLIALHCAFFKDAWNVFDFVVVTTDLIFSVMGIFLGSFCPISVLRVFRLAKVARISKVLRVFPELRLMLAGLAHSFSAIFWGTLLLVLCLLVWSMMAVLFIHPLNVKIDYDGCERCPRAYSSVMQAMLTFWQQIVAGDSWAQATIPLIEKHPATAVYFFGVFLSVGLAVMNLILGVVVSVAQSAKDKLEVEEHTERALTKLENETHFYNLCKHLDADGSGELNRQEISASVKKPGQFHDLLSAFNITSEDFEVAWTVMDNDGSGTVSYKEFVSGLCKMRSADTRFLLAYIKHHIGMIHKKLHQLIHIGLIHMSDQDVAVKEAQEASCKASEKEQKAKANEAPTSKEAACASEANSEPGSKTHQVEQNGALDQGKIKYPLSKADQNAEALKKLKSHSKEETLQVVEKVGALEEETATWVKAIFHDIGASRKELMRKLLEIERKLGPRELPLLAPVEDRVFIREESRELLVPVNQVSCSILPTCCTTPEPKDKRSSARSVQSTGIQSHTLLPIPDECLPLKHA